MRQTTVQVAEAIRFGSGKMEVGANLGALVDVGAIQDGVWEETFDKVRIMSDNAGEVEAGIRNHKGSFSANLMEINLDRLAQFYSGTHSLSTAPAAPAAVADEAVVLNDTNAIRLLHKNADGSEVTAITVRSAAGGGGALHARNADYVLSVDPAGYTTIARITAAGIADGATVYVSYTYTPAASRSLKAGGLVTLTAQVVRFTNTDAVGKVFRITLYRATAEQGIKIEFPADEDEAPAMVPIKMTGVLDHSRTAGDQLFEIYDEQHSA